MTHSEFLQELCTNEEEERLPYILEILSLYLLKKYRAKYLDIMQGTSVFNRIVESLKSAEVKTEKDVIDHFNANKHFQVITSFQSFIPKTILGMLQLVADEVPLSLAEIVSGFIQFSLMDQQNDRRQIYQPLKIGVVSAYCSVLGIPCEADNLETREQIIERAEEEAKKYEAKQFSDPVSLLKEFLNAIQPQ